MSPSHGCDIDFATVQEGCAIDVVAAAHEYMQQVPGVVTDLLTGGLL